MRPQAFLNLTFMILLFALITMQKLAPLVPYFENDGGEFRAGSSKDPEFSIQSNTRRLSQLTVFFRRLADSLAETRLRTEILAAWPLESNTVQWSEYYATTPVEKDLIAARFHVENAEVYEWALRNQQKTMAELNKAERFVQDARPLIKNPALITIDTVANELAMMKTDAAGEGAGRPANYETVKKDLDRVIRWVHTTGL
jgi:hypothetical protein